nr:phosphocholine cytidylyltransferase family protein [uncultured Methanospirillum sp.]
MNLIILAAGIGSRLYPLTKETPKCLLKINESDTLLEKTIRIINQSQIKFNKTIVVGFKADQIINKINNFNVVINPFFRVTNSIASLWLSREHLNSDILIINGDICFSEIVLRKILESTLENFVVIDSSKKCNDADYKIVFNNGLVSNMGKNIPFDNYSGEYAGITKLNNEGSLLLKKKIDEMINEEHYDTWYETALLALIRDNNFQLSYLDISGDKWVEIDSSKDLEYAKQIFII